MSNSTVVVGTLVRGTTLLLRLDLTIDLLLLLLLLSKKLFLFQHSYAQSLILLILFTIAAMYGGVLYALHQWCLEGKYCTSIGRITPNIYKQMNAVVSMSFGLQHYGPFLAQLEDCTFVRQTFSSISASLGKYSYWIYVGLAMVSAAVMLSLIFWVIYARERRHRKYNKESKEVMMQDK